MRQHKTPFLGMRLTSKHGGVQHTLDSFGVGMLAIMKCGLVLRQWREADSTGHRCKHCVQQDRVKPAPQFAEGRSARARNGTREGACAPR